MSTSSPNSLLPAPWSAWRNAVDALVTALAGALALYKNPETRIDRTEWDKKVLLIAEKLAACKAAADVVGTESERVTVCRTLKRIQVDAEAWADWVLSSGRELNLDDSDAVQRWHARATLPIDRLRIGLMNRTIQIEMDESAKAPPAPQYVLRDQMAVICGKTKKTIARWLKADRLPLPDVEGGGGKADQWIWANVRPHLERLSGRTLPETFPSLYPPS